MPPRSPIQPITASSQKGRVDTEGFQVVGPARGVLKRKALGDATVNAQGAPQAPRKAGRPRKFSIAEQGQKALSLPNSQSTRVLAANKENQGPGVEHRIEADLETSNEL